MLQDREWSLIFFRKWNCTDFDAFFFCTIYNNNNNVPYIPKNISKNWTLIWIYKNVCLYLRNHQTPTLSDRCHYTLKLFISENTWLPWDTIAYPVKIHSKLPSGFRVMRIHGSNQANKNKNICYHYIDNKVHCSK